MYQKSQVQLDEISLHLILRETAHNIGILILTALIAVFAVGSGYNLFYTPEYTSTSTISIQTKGTADVNTYASLSTNSEMAQVFQQVFQSPVLQKAVEEITGPIPPQTRITTEVMSGTNLLLLHVTARNPEAAYQMIQEIIADHHVVSDYMFSNAAVEVVSNPEVPMFPSNPVKVWKWEALGAVIGFLFAAALLVVYTALSSTVKTGKGAERNVEGQMLGMIPHGEKNRTLREKIRKSNKGLLITNQKAGLSFEEEYNRLALRVGYRMRMEHSKALLVTSVVENEGKTTVAANLALALAMVNPEKKIALLDLDFKSPAMCKLFGSRAQLHTGLIDYLCGKAELADILVYDKDLYIYQIFNSRHTAISRRILNGKRMQHMLEELKDKMDFIIVDSPPFSAGADTRVLSEHMDASLLVIRQNYVRVSDLNDGIEVLSGAQGKYLGYILNDFDDMIKKRTEDQL